MQGMYQFELLIDVQNLNYNYSKTSIDEYLQFEQMFRCKLSVNFEAELGQSIARKFVACERISHFSVYDCELMTRSIRS